MTALEYHLLARAGATCALRWGVRALNRRLLGRSVHLLDLTIGPKMVRLSETVLDAVCITKHVEHTDAPPRPGQVFGNVLPRCCPER